MQSHRGDQSPKRTKHKANHAGEKYKDDSSSAGWVDCGFWSDQPYICAVIKNFFSELHSLDKPLKVMLGDGHAAAGSGVVLLDMRLPNKNMQRCKLRNVLYVPSLSYNLLSVSKVARSGKITNLVYLTAIFWMPITS